ncbi:maleylacetate reductase [Rhodococcus opacus]|uniref:Maleylacetate reductase n=1 Tax=Rhodococcus opacus TaxID=37919 RepID=A0A2S8J896_RHOOP|nr:maleylacetate reductase [Rhodococcus opacus]PQP22762.1 maleylacetate reductase [Rhodococcus opacus]
MSTPDAFVHTSQPSRVIFGSGRLSELPAELDRLQLSRVIVICTPPQQATGNAVADLCGHRAHSVYPHATMHVPRSVAAAACEYVNTHEIDGAVVVGGGSSVGLGKALALETGLPILAIPTTYAGSEMTPIWGITDHGDKTTGRDVKVLPRTVIYDPDLTLTLPASLSVSSGLNALAHAAEALYAPDGSPIIEMMAGEAARALTKALPAVATNPTDKAARAELLYGAWLSGACLGATSMSLHHKLCHIIGGTFDLPHSEVHAIVLPHVLSYNLDGAPRARGILSRAVGADDPAALIYSLSQQIGSSTSLQDLGMSGGNIELVVSKATANPYSNPRPVTAESIRSIVSGAFFGTPPKRNP